MLDRDSVCINQSVAVLRFRNSDTRDFVFTYLASPIGRFRLIADAGGSTIKHIYISKLAMMLTPAPPLREANAIGRVIANANAMLPATSDIIKPTKGGITTKDATNV